MSYVFMYVKYRRLCNYIFIVAKKKKKKKGIGFSGLKNALKSVTNWPKPFLPIDEISPIMYIPA